MINSEFKKTIVVFFSSQTIVVDTDS